jgi:hypothetical protein
MARNEEVGLAEAAKVMGVTWASAWSALLRGELEGRKVGGRWRVLRASVDTWRRNAAERAGIPRLDPAGVPER